MTLSFTKCSAQNQAFLCAMSFHTPTFLMKKLRHREVKYWDLTKIVQLQNPGFCTALSHFYRLLWNE